MRTVATTLLTAAAATALLAAAPSPASADAKAIDVHAFNFTNSGEDAGNDSWLEIDRSFNLAKGDGSPGSDVINEVSGASTAMSPGSASGALTGSSTTLTPGESDDE
ncbi:hypothetical protein [Actinomadura fibrosa]|uniref:Lamin tail domain-containing protein n=1 Tax=Actinomadura fibrosa TaxID=111802 RepID=A0ABW2XMN6_9ACTN|nr:hypothetical protein [Actinomadura fibrosa]